MAHILLVDDDKNFLDATVKLLEALGHRVSAAGTVAEAREQVTRETFTHLLLDLMLPDGSGLHVLDALPQGPDSVRVALITGHPSVKTLLKDLHGPNISYLVKPIDLARLEALLGDGQKPDSAVAAHFDHLVGESAPMQQLYEQIGRVAATRANVLLIGESGVGKEVVASAIHGASGAAGAFVAANCGAFSRELIGSELFGHEKGAFTGAVQRKPGLFEQALDGTLFLDEVTEMPMDLQPNLLRVLESHKVTRLGATSSIEVNCRVISATNRSEAAIAREQCLREDLYFRLAVFPIHIPPLRQRLEDIPLLVEHFLADFNHQYGSGIGVDQAGLDRLAAYDWPGNVRELRHVIHRACIMADNDSGLIRLPEDLASPFSRASGSDQAGVTVGKTVEELERELIESTLAHLNGDKKKAAEMLGISLKTLYNRLNSYAESSSGNH